ncbi:MAG: hypothetical protein JSW61_04980 [Candidatus Thorarchaeota archaeon]|nr:MAG: hypothetical protein JSW61_04980 [Candidatus Thorarchaeota archaeon]
MPIVELVAKKVIESNPDIGLGVVDMIVLLWLYTNPYSSHRRQLSSMKNILKMTETLQNAGGKIEVTEDELTQIVLASLGRLKDNGLVYIRSAGIHFVKGTLSEKGVNLVEKSIGTPVLRRITAEFGDNP